MRVRFAQRTACHVERSPTGSRVSRVHNLMLYRVDKIGFIVFVSFKGDQPDLEDILSHV